MRARSLLVVLCALALSACVVKTPQPLPTSVVTVDNSSGATSCQYTLAIPGNVMVSSTGVASATFTTPQALVNADRATAQCDGYMLATQAPASLLSNHVTLAIEKLPPATLPLPPPPSRDQLLHARPCFQGVTVTTKQLGAVPSFGGAETGMLSDPADRQAVYDSIKAAGCNAIVLAIDCHYTEDGVAYPDGTACNNDWTDTTARFPGATPYAATGDTSTIVARVAEAARAGLMVFYMQGADEIDFGTVAQQVGPQMAALRAYPSGDLTQWIQLGPGFDSIIPIANAAPYQTSNQTLVNLLLADRAACPTCVINLELPNGWAFAGGGDLSGAGWFQSDAGKTVNVYLEEFADDDPGAVPTPAIVSGTWDAEHNDYAPTFARDATSWMQVWQIADRLLPTWTEPADMPTSGKCSLGLAAMVPVTGGPQDGATACVFADVSTPTRYTVDLPAETVFNAFETATYRWTHGQTTTAAILANGKYLSGLGYQLVSVPTVASWPLPAALTFALRPAA
jgi:hypothetical protein